MTQPTLLHDLLSHNATRQPAATAISIGGESFTYEQLTNDSKEFAANCQALGLGRGDRVAIYLGKTREAIVGIFGASLFGCVVVPVNPALKPDQVIHVLRDSSAKAIVTSSDRFSRLKESLTDQMTQDLVVVAVDTGESVGQIYPFWNDSNPLLESRHLCTEHDTAAIFYTSGSTGAPKGVAVSHRNLVVGAISVTSYLGNTAEDTLLAALPLSFDAGFSQLTTGFLVGANVVLLDYLLPRDVIKACESHGVTGLTSVPPMFAQIANQPWPEECVGKLRYIASTGGHMYKSIIDELRSNLPKTDIYVMYGLTEAFRATYLPPKEIVKRPDSMGIPIPNNEIFILREDGTECDVDEVGELVQVGPLVTKGYWQAPELTAKRFRALPDHLNVTSVGPYETRTAVYSGDLVRKDKDGFLYYVGRMDDLIKSSGYRISPTEIEDVLLKQESISECAVFGIPDEKLGQSIIAVLYTSIEDIDVLRKICAGELPSFMVPQTYLVRDCHLPRNPNGKIDRTTLRQEVMDELE